MVRFASLLLAAALFSSRAAVAALEHRLSNEVLKAYVVKITLVDYATLKTDQRLTCYLAQLAATDLAELTMHNEQLAFWINAHNACFLKLVAGLSSQTTVTQRSDTALNERRHEEPS